MSVLLIIFSVLIVLLVKYMCRPYKPAVFGIYQQKNGFYLLKYALMCTFLTVRQLLLKKKRSEKLELVNGLYSTLEDRLMDVPQTLHCHPKAIDAVYFNGSSKDGAALVCGLARRPDKLCNSFLYLRVKGGELLLSPKLPDTTVYQTPEEEGKYQVGGLNLCSTELMKTWRIEYNGTMKLHNDPTKTVDVKLDATWNTTWNHFNYDYDMSPSSMASDMAREIWSRDYFDILKEVHQTHYEQHGNIKGTVIINEESHNIEVESVRDHSFGKLREWKNFHRYGIHYIALENGDRISVGKICMPVCFSGLTMGFICRQEDQQIYNVDSCDLELFRFGENSRPPVDYAFEFTAGGKLYTVQVDVTDSPTFYIGPEHECRVVERLAKFTVNGIPGWGAAEWQYRNMDRNVLRNLRKE